MAYHHLETMDNVIVSGRLYDYRSLIMEVQVMQQLIIIHTEEMLMYREREREREKLQMYNVLISAHDIVYFDEGLK